MHGDRRLAGPSGGEKEAPCRLLVDPTRLTDDPDAPIHQFPAPRLDIHHEVPVHLAQPDHHAGGERVEDELRRGARLHSRGTRDDLGAHQGSHHHVRQSAQVVGWRRAAQETDSRPASPRLLESRAHERRAARRGDPEDEVRGPDSHIADRHPRRIFVVLRPFPAHHQCLRPTRDDTPDEVGLRAERRWTLGGIEHAEPPARSGSYVDQPATATDPLRDLLDEPGDPLGLRSHGGRHEPVLGADQLDDPGGRRPVDPRGERVAGFRQTTVQLQLDPSFAGLATSSTFRMSSACHASSAPGLRFGGRALAASAGASGRYAA